MTYRNPAVRHWTGAEPAGELVSDTSREAQIGALIDRQPNGCWLFKGRADTYGRIRVPDGFQQVHRYVYELMRGPIPDGHHLHHRCQTPGGCNPRHLMPLTPVEHKAAHR